MKSGYKTDSIYINIQILSNINICCELFFRNRWCGFLYIRDCRGRDCMAVGLRTTCAISAYHH